MIRTNSSRKYLIRLLIMICTVTVVAIVSVQGQTIAFPGAEGAGRFTSGGRGTPSIPTAVFKVTSLEDDNIPGTLRYAIQASQTTNPHRTIVFDVSGTIRLKSPLIVRNNVTIAGQTAPGDGICIADYPVTISGNNVILRYLRIRLGDRYQNKGKVPGSGNDDALGSLGYKNIIVDHCSISWSADEACTIYRGDSLTLQWNIISEPLNYSYHFEDGDTDFQEHAYGGIWGARRASFHHNIIAHCKGRMPRFAGSSTYPPGTAGQENANFYNNVIYNWQLYSTNGGEGGNYNLMNNYYKYGPNTATGSSAGIAVRQMIMNPSKSGELPWPKLYLNGNMVDGYPAVSSRNWLGVAMAGGTPADTLHSKVDTPFDIAPYTLQSAEDAYAAVLAGAGALLPRRDTLDRRIVNDIIWRVGRIIDVQRGFAHGTPFEQTINAWPVLNSKPAPLDTDADGMPDAWELANGLNPNNPADRANLDGEGYTALERYLNGIVNTQPEIYYSGVLNMFNGLAGLPSVSQQYTIAGQRLEPAVMVLAPQGFELSADGGNTWVSGGNPLMLSVIGDQLPLTPLQVRLNASVAGAYSGYIKHYTAHSDTTYLYVTGLATQPGVETSTLAWWPLTVNNQDDPSKRHPGVEVALPAFSNYYLSNGTTVAAVPAYGNTHGQAFSPAADGSGLWTTVSGGNGSNLNRLYYQQFILTAKSGYQIAVDSLVLNASFYNTSSNTRFAVVYSKTGFMEDSANVTGGIGPDGILASGANGAFATPILLPNQTNGNSSMYRLALNGATGIVLNPGEQITVRLYFSCGSTSTGRYAKIKNLQLLGRANGALPLSRFQLDAYKMERSVLLNWQVQPNEMVNRFMIERASKAGVFDGVGSVPAQPGVGSMRYQFSDVSVPVSGIYWYRVRSHHINGETSYSRVVAVNMGSMPGFIISPNPVQEQIMVTHPVLLEAVTLKILNTQGQVLHLQQIPKGTTQTHVQASGLVPGVYWLQFINGTVLQTTRFVKQ